jgi:hypothetical protein
MGPNYSISLVDCTTSYFCGNLFSDADTIRKKNT